jgi:hypothetical protein
MKRPEGLLTISGIKDAEGKPLSTQQAVDYGWITPSAGNFAGWGLARHEVPLGKNLFVDQGRQLVAYAFGFRSPISDYTVQKFGVGTGTTPAKVTDVALQAPITLSNSSTLKNIDSVDFLAPFVVRVSFTLGNDDANGYIISEMGLFSGGSALIARKVRSVSINKTSDYSPTLTWRIRF